MIAFEHKSIQLNQTILFGMKQLEMFCVVVTCGSRTHRIGALFYREVNYGVGN